MPWDWPGCSMGIHPWFWGCFLLAGATPVPASSLLREQGAYQEHPQCCHHARTSHRGASKRAKLSKSSQEFSAGAVDSRPMSRCTSGFPQLWMDSISLQAAPRSFSLPASSPRVLQDFTSRTGKQKQKETPRLFYNEVQERRVNAWAVIQVGTWSWKVFSSQTQRKPQHLALCCSFIHGVIFGFLLLGEQD